MALREIFDVSGGENIIAKAQAGKTNLKHGAYLHKPNGVQPSQHVTHAHTRAVGVAV